MKYQWEAGMRINHHPLKKLIVGLLLIILLSSSSFASNEKSHNQSAIIGQEPQPGESYRIGNPTMLDLYVSPAGNDQNNGLTREKPLQTIGAAWAMVPQGTLENTGYRINLLPGTYPCEGDCINYFDNRQGTYSFPILLRSVDGPQKVTLKGGLNLNQVSYLYLFDLTLKAGREAGAAFGNNVLHIENGDHLLLRGLTLQGPQKCLNDSCNDMQEVLKVNQSQYVYLEKSDLSGSYQTVLDYFSVQHGHILANHIHQSGGRCAYVKGGSAYLLVDGNEFNDCVESGFQAGEGSNLAFMREPWLHYEAYDIKVVNNILHDIHGAGLSVSGGFNILMAYNTLYKVGLEDEGGRPWALLQLVYGMRGCYPADEYGGAKGTQTKCQQWLEKGGWGTAALGDDQAGEWIPNRNVFIYNNIFYNPTGSTTRYVQFVVNGPIHPPKQARNLPDPIHTDKNLVIRNNFIWNKITGGGELLGDNNGSGNLGCRNDNLACNVAQLTKENFINQFEPQLRDPAGGDFRLAVGSNLLAVKSIPIPDFSWRDAPSSPLVPQGMLANQVGWDYLSNQRIVAGPLGAYYAP
jgi:hypothetical protein